MLFLDIFCLLLMHIVIWRLELNSHLILNFIKNIQGCLGLGGVAPLIWRSFLTGYVALLLKLVAPLRWLMWPWPSPSRTACRRSIGRDTGFSEDSPRIPSFSQTSSWRRHCHHRRIGCHSVQLLKWKYPWEKNIKGIRVGTRISRLHSYSKDIMHVWHKLSFYEKLSNYFVMGRCTSCSLFCVPHPPHFGLSCGPPGRRYVLTCVDSTTAEGFEKCGR